MHKLDFKRGNIIFFSIMLTLYLLTFSCQYPFMRGLQTEYYYF